MAPSTHSIPSCLQSFSSLPYHFANRLTLEKHWNSHCWYIQKITVGWCTTYNGQNVNTTTTIGDCKNSGHDTDSVNTTTSGEL